MVRPPWRTMKSTEPPSLYALVRAGWRRGLSMVCPRSLEMGVGSECFDGMTVMEKSPTVSVSWYRYSWMRSFFTLPPRQTFFADGDP